MKFSKWLIRYFTASAILIALVAIIASYFHLSMGLSLILGVTATLIALNLTFPDEPIT